MAFSAKDKAAVHAALAIPKPFAFDGIAITITALGIEGDMLRVDLEADCPTDGPYFFVNPPLHHGGRKNPAAALKVIVGQAVRTVAVQKGWKA